MAAPPPPETNRPIPLSRPWIAEEELTEVQRVLQSLALAGDGQVGRAVESELRRIGSVQHALLTTSCSHALELAMLVLGIGPGDEVIMPSFTFAATANAVALRGARPVFVDIDAGTWNVDPARMEAAITPRTRILLPVHYAGQACDMERVGALARERDLAVIEDAAQGVGATWRGQALGTIGEMGCLSFHNTKNLVAGEGGALLTNDEQLGRRAEIMREKGTNRAAFFRGEIDKYTWVDIGSSYVLSELQAALLGAQLRRLEAVTRARLQLWTRYQQAFAPFARDGIVRLQKIHPDAQINGHLFAFLVHPSRRDALLDRLRARKIGATFHYVPLHSAPAAARFGPSPSLPITDRVSESLVRLPLFPELGDDDQQRIIDATFVALEELKPPPVDV